MNMLENFTKAEFSEVWNLVLLKYFLFFAAVNFLLNIFYNCIVIVKIA